MQVPLDYVLGWVKDTESLQGAINKLKINYEESMIDMYETYNPYSTTMAHNNHKLEQFIISTPPPFANHWGWYIFYILDGLL